MDNYGLDLRDKDLEDFGRGIFERLGLQCFHRLNNVLVPEIDKEGSYSSGEHLELDYLIPYDSYCLVGEITGRSDESDLRKKYKRFRSHYNVVSKLELNEDLWRLLGISNDDLRHFRYINKLRGFFITTQLERFDVELSDVEKIVRFYRKDWRLLVDYAEGIGRYAGSHLLERFDIAETEPYEAFTLRREAHNLMYMPHRRIASGVDLASLYTFEVSPYDILSLSLVYRRDLLPSLSPELKYQRALNQDKLDEIRKSLLHDPDFVFPSSILVVLSEDCEYDEVEEELRIPKRYGAFSVIDGQHRLFSYADEEIKEQVGNESKIMVTAIQFETKDPEVIFTHSAKTFVEINTNQTKVDRDHLDAIAYDVLGDTEPRAIAAKIILEVNEKKDTCLYGFFDTNRTGLGIVRASTVRAALQTITSLKKVRRLKNAQRGSTLERKNGYENLLGASIDELSTAENLIEQGKICMERYFGVVASAFRPDWPKRGESNESSFKYAKMIAGFVKLLRQFINEGLDWGDVQRELETIRENVMVLRGMSDYDTILFDPTHLDIPDAEPSATDDFRFLNLNRTAPTSVQDKKVQGLT